MSIDTQIREAERAGDIVYLTRLLIRAGFSNRAVCPHCDRLLTGYPAWQGVSTEQWPILRGIGLPFRCSPRLNGCDKLFVRYVKDNK